MKRNLIGVIALLLAALVCSGMADKKKGDGQKSDGKNAVDAQTAKPKGGHKADVPSAPPPMDEQSRNMMDAYMKAGQPGMNHKFLAQLEGKWKAVVKTWMGTGEPSVTEGASVNELLYGGRYLQQNYTGDFMGQKFQGLGLMGYDNIQRKFTSTWIDSMSTAISIGLGDLDAAGKVLTMTTTSSDPMTGAVKSSREVLRIMDPGAFVLEMYEMSPEGREVMSMEITYTQQKGKGK